MKRSKKTKSERRKIHRRWQRRYNKYNWPRTVTVVDQGNKTGSISYSNWMKVQEALPAILDKLVLESPGTYPACVDVGWFRECFKLTECRNQRSIDLYIKAINQLGELWPGASLVVIDKDQIPPRPRAEAKIAYEGEDRDVLLELIRKNNPELPTRNWEIATIRPMHEGRRTILFIINKKSMDIIKNNNGEVSLGDTKISLRTYGLKESKRLTSRGYIVNVPQSTADFLLTLDNEEETLANIDSDEPILPSLHFQGSGSGPNQQIAHAGTWKSLPSAKGSHLKSNKKFLRDLGKQSRSQSGGNKNVSISESPKVIPRIISNSRSNMKTDSWKAMAAGNSKFKSSNNFAGTSRFSGGGQRDISSRVGDFSNPFLPSSANFEHRMSSSNNIPQSNQSSMFNQSISNNFGESFTSNNFSRGFNIPLTNSFGNTQPQNDFNRDSSRFGGNMHSNNTLSARYTSVPGYTTGSISKDFDLSIPNTHQNQNNYFGPSQLNSNGSGNNYQRGGSEVSAIVIKNLPSTCTSRILQDNLRGMGDIIFAEMQGNNTGIVRFANERDAQMAIKCLDGSYYEGRTINVSSF